MVNTFELDRFRVYINVLEIDLRFNLLDEELTDSYYSQYPNHFIEIEDTIDEHGNHIWGHFKREDIWVLIINEKVEESYFMTYQSLEKSLLWELDLNLRVAEYQHDVIVLYKDLLDTMKVLTDKIVYDRSSGSIDISKCSFGPQYSKYKHKTLFDQEIKRFLERFKVQLSYTYSLIINKLPVSGFTPKLKWDGTNVDLIKLITALKESGSIKPRKDKMRDEEVVAQFSAFFGQEIPNYDSQLSKSRNTNNAERIFFDKLANSLKKYYERLDN